jgi:hypothetical protein
MLRDFGGQKWRAKLIFSLCEDLVSELVEDLFREADSIRRVALVSRKPLHLQC